MRFIATALIVFLSWYLLASPGPAIHFRDVSPAVGFEQSNQPITPDRRYVVESMAGGIALFDCDNDGRLDMLAVAPSTVDHFLHGGDPMVSLYHQEANGKFVDITK